MNEIDDIPLRRIGVAIFELEDFVHTILFECWKLDEKTEESSQVLSDHQVLLPPYLGSLSVL